MIQYNEYFQSTYEVSKLGYSSNNSYFIPKEYLEHKQFIIFRTCHSYGDWVILSAMPRLIKQKYPDCTVVIPSPNCISKYFNPNQWKNKHENPFNNVIEIFANNPYVDGMIDEIPIGIPVYHDHFRIYDNDNPNIPLIKQMLKFWRFEDYEMIDCQPELYWNSEEIKIGDSIIKKIFNSKEFGFLYIDDIFFQTNPEYCGKPLERKRQLLQQEILKHNIDWIYYTHDGIFHYNTNNKVVNIKDYNISLRIQNYIKSKAKLIIGHQGGFGTDVMARYTDCYVVPIGNNINEHFGIGINYILN